ncbi:MAG: LysR family transcriptional regulator [Bacteroidetes bacterium]|nr:LysR family transcriptional regulator [Bacteroidota bacterium]
MPKPKKYTIRVRFWVDETSGPFLGIGRVLLLEQIKITGSITGAAKELKMSYRQAWQLVSDMNKCSDKPLVEKQLGGSAGGGAFLTPAGEVAIKQFYKIDKQLKAFAEKLNAQTKL